MLTNTGTLLEEKSQLRHAYSLKHEIRIVKGNKETPAFEVSTLPTSNIVLEIANCNNNRQLGLYALQQEIVTLSVLMDEAI